MPQYEEEHKTVDVPKGAGIPGLVSAVTSILELPRVQSIHIENGTVSYTRFKKAGDPDVNVDQDFDSIMPWQIVRSRDISEVIITSTNAAVVLGQMFAMTSMDGYNPVAFVGSPASKFWAWYTGTTSLMTGRDDLHGFPFHVDKQVPDEALILCVALGRRASMVDVVKSYKVTVPQKRSKA